MSALWLAPLTSLAPAAIAPLPSALARLRRWVAFALGGAPPRLQLPFAGLPDGIATVPAGRAALVLYSDGASRERLLHAVLQSDARPVRMTWVCDPERSFVALGAAVRAAGDAGTLHALSWSPGSIAQMRQHGPLRLMQELAVAGDHPGDLLVVDLLDPWLAELGHNAAPEAAVIEALRCLQHWSRYRQGPVLAIAPERFRGQPLLPLLAQSGLSRLALFNVQESQPRLEVLRWSRAGTHHPAALTGYTLQGGADGPWACVPGATASSLEAADRDVVHTTRGAVQGLSPIPENWCLHPGLDALVEATHDAQAATVLLAHDHPDAIGALAQTVHRLRQGHPHLLRIVVREVGVPMRRNSSLALRRLGANAVVERDQGPAQLLERIGQLREESYAGAACADPGQALQRLAPDPVQGYLPIRDFCAAVERMLDRTAGTPMEHSLVRLPLLPHVAHVDALQACSARRNGDLVTADAGGITLFLYGCPPHSAMTALESMFSTPSSELAHHVDIDPDALSQRDAVQHLRRRADESPVDYTPFLRGAAVARHSPGIQAAVLPTRGNEATRSVKAHVLPVRATL